MEQENKETGNTGKQEVQLIENMSRDITDKNSVISAMTL